jgi:hypothetical protein
MSIGADPIGSYSIGGSSLDDVSSSTAVVTTRVIFRVLPEGRALTVDVAGSRVFVVPSDA